MQAPEHYTAREAALSVLGGLFLAGAEAFALVRDICPADAFADQGHREVVAAVDWLVRAGQPIDPVTVLNRMTEVNTAGLIGGMAGLVELSAAAASAVNIEHHARIVREAWQRRQARVQAAEYIKALDAGHGTTAEVSGAVAQRLQRYAGAGDDGPKMLRELLATEIDGLRRKVQAVERGEPRPVGVSTGLTALDGLLNGLEPGELVILAGRPAMGKSALAMAIAQHVAKSATVILHSLEMTALQVARRALASEARVHGEKLKTGQGLTPSDIDRILQGARTLSPLALAIDDRQRTLDEVAAGAHRQAARREGPPLGLLVIDYLQLLKHPRGSRSREQEVSEDSRGLKQLAKSLGVPVIALAQLSRKVEDRPNKRPTLSDLRESGAIEQDADLVLFVYRDEYYNEKSEDRGIAEVIVGKARSGSTGTAKVGFTSWITRFADLPSALDKWNSADAWDNSDKDGEE